MAAFANQEKYIEHTEMLINKFRAKASKASMAQSLIKKLDKIDRIEVDEEDNTTLRFRFPPAPRSGKVVVEAENLAKRYGDHTIFSKVDFMIEREERVAFVGKNGEGKSTLSKIIAGVESHEGKLTIGYNVKIGYFAQNQAEILDGEKTVFQTIDDVAEGEIRKNVRGLLGSFLFGGDAVDKKVKVLSGGEKNRLALCKLLLQPYNLLILDEPTNHLDMRSKEMLKTALLKYDGTLIVVSHDRDFLQGLTGKVFEFSHGKIKQHIGDLQTFLSSRKIQNLSQLEVKATINGKEKKSEEKSEPRQEHEAKKKLEKELKAAQNVVLKSEKEIENIEQQIKEMDENLLDPEYYREALKDNSVFERYNELKQKLDKELLEWELKQNHLNNLQKNL